MAIYELMFDPRDGAQKGHVLAIAEHGVHMTPAQWNAFLADETVLPPNYSERVTAEKHGSYLRLRQQINEMQTGDDDETRRVKVWGPTVTDDGTKADQIEQQNASGAQGMAADAYIQQYGEDTNFGHEDLMVLGVLVTDMTAQEVSEFQEADLDPNVHALQPVENCFRGPRKRVVDVDALGEEVATGKGNQGKAKGLLKKAGTYTEDDAARHLEAQMDGATYSPPDRDYTPIKFTDTTVTGKPWHALKNP